MLAIDKMPDIVTNGLILLCAECGKTRYGWIFFYRSGMGHIRVSTHVSFGNLDRGRKAAAFMPCWMAGGDGLLV